MIAVPPPPIASARIGLRLFRPELNRAILVEALAIRPMTVSHMCAQLMLESDTTLRVQLDQLEEVGVVANHGGGLVSGGEFRLTAAGDDLLEVMALTGAWLTRNPSRSLSPMSDASWRAYTALGDGWEISLIQHLLVQPSTKSELRATIPSLGTQKLKRMLRRLRGADLLELLDGSDLAVPCYGLTHWCRQAITVLVAIAHWERAHLDGGAEPVVASDGAIALLASLPLILLPTDASGICAFTVEVERTDPSPRSSAVWARLVAGRVTTCASGSSLTPPDAWVHGRIDDWLDAIINGRPGALRLGGNTGLAESALLGLHEELFGATVVPL